MVLEGRVQVRWRLLEVDAGAGELGDPEMAVGVELDVAEHDVVAPAPQILLQQLQVLLVVIDRQDDVPLRKVGTSSRQSTPARATRRTPTIPPNPVRCRRPIALRMLRPREGEGKGKQHDVGGEEPVGQLLRAVERRYRRWTETLGDPVSSGLAQDYLAWSSTVGTTVSVALTQGLGHIGRTSVVMDTTRARTELSPT